MSHMDSDAVFRSVKSVVMCIPNDCKCITDVSTADADATAAAAAARTHFDKACKDEADAVARMVEMVTKVTFKYGEEFNETVAQVREAVINKAAAAAAVEEAKSVEKAAKTMKKTVTCRCSAYTAARARAAARAAAAATIGDKVDDKEFDVIFDALYDVSVFINVTHYCISLSTTAHHIIANVRAGRACTVVQAVKALSRMVPTEAAGERVATADHTRPP